MNKHCWHLLFMQHDHPSHMPSFITAYQLCICDVTENISSYVQDVLGGAVGKESACQSRRRSMPGWGTSPGEEGTAAHSSILPWRIPEGSLVGYSPWGLRDSDTVKGLSSHARILNGLTARATAVNNDQLKKKTHKMFSPIDVIDGCKCVSEAGGRNVANKENMIPYVLWVLCPTLYTHPLVITGTGLGKTDRYRLACPARHWVTPSQGLDSDHDQGKTMRPSVSVEAPWYNILNKGTFFLRWDKRV